MNFQTDSLSRLRAFGLTLCLFMMVVGANWAAFIPFGSDMPNWDQWDAEAANLFAPWYGHDHFVAHLFQPHNEHRVVMTKLQNLVVCGLNGQWDARLECCFNAILHGLIAVALWVLGRRWLRPAWQAPYYIIVVALYGVPLAWQNLLGGFHSQQYWLIVLSLGAIATLPFARTGTRRWWFGLGCSILALGTMGSGFLAAAVVVGLLVWRLLRRETSFRDCWLTLVIVSAEVVVGLLTRVEFSGHQVLKAKTLHDFVFSILRSLEWPLRNHDWAGAITWAPWVIVAVGALLHFRTREAAAESRSKPELIIVGLGGWVLVQLLATAYARGANADYPASRYMDTLIFATAVNGLAMAWLLSGRSQRPTASTCRSRLGLCTVALGWSVAVIAGASMLVRDNLYTDLPGTKQYHVQTEAHLRAFLATNDRAELVEPIPYPNHDALVERLSLPAIRDLMPQSVRPALPLHEAGAPLPVPNQSANTTSSAFSLNFVTQQHLKGGPRNGLAPSLPPAATRPTWGSYGAAGLATTGTWRSEPISAKLKGWLQFETAGDIGRPGITLELRDAATDRRLGEIRPTRSPNGGWRAAYVRTPRAPFVVVANDSSPVGWLGFGAPVEMASGSYWAWQCMKNGLLLAIAGALLALVLGLWVIATQSPEKS